MFPVFLDHDGLRHVIGLRKEGKLDEAEELLKQAEPSPAVLDELRKIASQRASLAKKENDWASVVLYLEGYTAYANKWTWYCRRMVNADPPCHTEKDIKLLQVAKTKLNQP